MAQLFMPKNAIFGHFNPLPLIRISQKLSSHSKILIFTTPKDFGQIPSAQKIWRNFLCQKMLFLAIFTHFLCTKFHKNSLSLQKWQYLPLKEILGNLMQRKCQKMAKNSIFWPKNSYFWPFLYGRQHQIARSGEY